MVLKLFKNPLLLGVMLGVAFQLFDWKLPYVVEESVEMLSGSVTSLVLISLGVFTATIQKSDWLDYKAMLVFYLQFTHIFKSEGNLTNFFLTNWH